DYGDGERGAAVCHVLRGSSVPRLGWPPTGSALLTLYTVQVSMALIGSVTCLLDLPTTSVRFSEFCLHYQTMANNCTQSHIFLFCIHKCGNEMCIICVIFVGHSEQVPMYWPEGLHSEADTAFPRKTLLSNTTETEERPLVPPSERPPVPPSERPPVPPRETTSTPLRKNTSTPPQKEHQYPPQRDH
ncbi:unnamed protein product, partial [Coregonus sp. 'balchen']